MRRKNGYTSENWQGPEAGWREAAGAGGEWQRTVFWGLSLVNQGLLDQGLLDQGLLGDQGLLPVLPLGEPCGLPDWRRARIGVLSVHSIR